MSQNIIFIGISEMASPGYTEGYNMFKDTGYMFVIIWLHWISLVHVTSKKTVVRESAYGQVLKNTNKATNYKKV